MEPTSLLVVSGLATAGLSALLPRRRPVTPGAAPDQAHDTAPDPSAAAAAVH